MASASGLTVPALRVDGGAAANDWLMQFQADVLGIPVERPDLVETTALGAAGLAGLALGVWRTSGEFLQRPARSAASSRQWSPGPGGSPRRVAAGGGRHAGVGPGATNSS